MSAQQSLFTISGTLGEDHDVGIARTLRQHKTPVAQTVIDNDNMSKIMDQVETHRQAGSLMFSFDNKGKTFSVSSPAGSSFFQVM